MSDISELFISELAQPRLCFLNLRSNQKYLIAGATMKNVLLLVKNSNVTWNIQSECFILTLFFTWANPDLFLFILVLFS